jgi:polysaccharide export outer membrane protein
MLRPVPVAGGADASAWTPVQRVSDPPNDSNSNNSNRVGMDSAPQPESDVQTTRYSSAETPLTPMPIPGEGPKLDDPRFIVAPPPPARSSTPTTLPTPRPVPGPVKHPAGYPELPPALIAHPAEAPREFAKRAYSAYIIEPPDVLAIEGIGDIGDPKLPITGPHLVRPDGTIGLGTYGSVFVAGMTIDQAKEQIALLIQRRQTKLTMKQLDEGLKVDVAAYNSKFYYVITDGGGFGETVVRVPCTGNETVLDAISQIQGLPAVASKKRIWIARATPEGHLHPYVLAVDWRSVTECGSAATNYQLYPGDRIYVDSNKFIRADSYLAKFLAPIERLLGATLLGSSVVNSIKGTSTGAGSGVVR